jgi:hypothetical protein
MNLDRFGLSFLDIIFNLNIKNFFLQLSLVGEERLILVDGGKRDNILDDSSTFERMEVSKGSFGSLKS